MEVWKASVCVCGWVGGWVVLGCFIEKFGRDLSLSISNEKASISFLMLLVSLFLTVCVCWIKSNL